MQPKEILKLMRRWVWVLLAGLVIGVLGGWIYSYFQTPIYQASTKILVMNTPESNNPNVVSQSSQELYQIFIELLVTRPVLNATSEKLGYYVSGNQITIREQQLIQVIVTDENPRHAAEIANTLVSTFLDQNELMQTSRYSTSEESLQAQIQQVEAQIAELQTQLIDNSAKTQDERIQSVTDIIAGLQTEITDLQEEIIRLQYNETLVDMVAPNGLIIKVTPTPSLDELINLNRNQNRLTELKALLDIYQKIYVDLSFSTNSPNIQSGEANDRISAALGLYQQIYENLLSNYEAIRLARLQSTPNIVQVEQATEPTKPIRPKTTNNMAIGGFIGLLLVGIAVFLIEYLDDSIRDANMIYDILQLPVLGTITKMDKNLNSDIPFVLDQPRSPISEAFRSLRGNLDFTSLDDSIRSILITSPEADEGKTTIAVNLALVVAQSGKKIVLLDGNLRRPQVHEKFGLSNRIGLSDLLRENMPLEDVFQTIGEENLVVITSGSLPPNPAEVAGSEKMASVIETLKQQFDLVIIDSVPYFLAEASTLASMVDGVLIVVCPRKTSQTATVDMLDKMDRAGVRPVGVVLNQVKNEDGDGYYQVIKNYDHFSYEKHPPSVPKEQ